jgi:hypothetical protein
MAETTPRVLVVDDERFFREAIQETLAEAGIDCEAVGSGERGLAAARDPRVGVVVLDVSLQDISGVDVLRRLRAERPAAAAGRQRLPGEAAPRRGAGAGGAPGLGRLRRGVQLAASAGAPAASGGMPGEARRARPGGELSGPGRRVRGGGRRGGGPGARGGKDLADAAGSGVPAAPGGGGQGLAAGRPRDGSGGAGRGGGRRGDGARGGRPRRRRLHGRPLRGAHAALPVRLGLPRRGTAAR